MHESAIGSAAIEVLAEAGSRGFTHRAVDQRAGLPEGTTSRYARTRAALLVLAADALFAADHSSTSQIDSVTPVEFLVAATTSLLAAPERYRARVELQLEAQRVLALRRHFAESRATFVRALATHLDVSTVQADGLVLTIDGVLQRQLILGEPALARRDLAELLERLVFPRA